MANERTCSHFWIVLEYDFGRYKSEPIQQPQVAVMASGQIPPTTTLRCRWDNCPPSEAETIRATRLLCPNCGIEKEVPPPAEELHEQPVECAVLVLPPADP